MATYCVYHLIHVRTPHQLIPELFITNVPNNKSIGWDLVDEYGWFGEFNILHANHRIEKLTTSSPPSLKRGLRECVPAISYEELIYMSKIIEPEVDPLTKRKRKVRDTLNRCKDPDIIEKIAGLLKC